MGRRQRRSKKKRQRKHATVVSERLSRAPESEPELYTSLSFTRGEDQYSSGANSYDEPSLSLCPSSLTCGKCQCRNLHHSPVDEMEVTRKLSCLNFSVLPSSVADNTGQEDSVQASSPGTAVLRDFEVLSDVELCSEMASATHLELLPTLSDREMEIEPCHRHARKRPSKRKTTRRTKKFRYMINTWEGAIPETHRHPTSSSAQQSLSVNFVRTSSKDTPTSPLSHHEHSTRFPPSGGQLTRNRSFRRVKRSQLKQEEDLLLCFLSDTSTVLDVDNSPAVSMVGRGNHDMEGVESIFPARPTAVTSEEKILPNESDLSETTTSDRYILY